MTSVSLYGLEVDSSGRQEKRLPCVHPCIPFRTAQEKRCRAHFQSCWFALIREVSRRKIETNQPITSATFVEDHSKPITTVGLLEIRGNVTSTLLSCHFFIETKRDDDGAGR